MGTYKRLPRGKAKPHDEFRDWTFHALVWIKANWQTALEFAVIVAVAFGIVLGASSYWRYRSESAAERLYAAMRLPAFSDEQIEKLKEISASYSRTPAGQRAMIMLGDVFMEKKDYDGAIEQFKKLSGRSRNHPMLMIAALHRCAEALAKKGDAALAAEMYLKAAANPHNLIASWSRYRAALSLEAAGDVSRAAGLYRQVISDAGEGDAAVRGASEERLIWLRANKKING